LLQQLSRSNIEPRKRNEFIISIIGLQQKAHDFASLETSGAEYLLLLLAPLLALRRQLGAAR